MNPYRSIVSILSKGKKRRTLISHFAVHVMLIIASLVIMFPFLWMISTSLKPTSIVITYPPQFIPRSIRLENFIDVFRLAPFAQFALNSAQIVFGNVVGTLFSSSLAAFAFARLRFKFKDFWFIIVLSTMMLPAVVTMVPTYVIMSRLGWVNTFRPLIVPSFFGINAFFIFLLRQFFVSIPLEMDDSARVDGCSNFGIYWRIMLPLSKPALGIVALFTFVGTYQDFMTPLIYLHSNDLFTLPIGLYWFKAVAPSATSGTSSTYGSSFNLMMAASILLTLPPILVFFFTQRYFVQGIVITGVKG